MSFRIKVLYRIVNIKREENYFGEALDCSRTGKLSVTKVSIKINIPRERRDFEESGKN